VVVICFPAAEGPYFLHALTFAAGDVRVDQFQDASGRVDLTRLERIGQSALSLFGGRMFGDILLSKCCLVGVSLLAAVAYAHYGHLSSIIFNYYGHTVDGLP